MTILAAVFENLNLGNPSGSEVLTSVMIRALEQSITKVDSQGIELLVLALALTIYRRYTPKRINDATPPSNAVKRDQEV